MKISLLAQMILIFATLLVTSCAPETIEPTATPPPTIEVKSFPAKLKIGGINIEFTGYTRDNDYLTITICFDPPSEEQWMFDDVIFRIDNQEIHPAWIISDSSPDRTEGFSCGSLLYPIDKIPDSGKAELSIGRLKTNIHKYDCNKAQRKLDEAKTGIVVTCDLSEFGADSGFGILEKPQNMSDDEAFKLVKDAFSDIVPANWRFSFLVEKP